MGEFDLIERYFTWGDSFNSALSQSNNMTQSGIKGDVNGVIKGVGDDAAVLSLAPDKHLVTSIDTLISGVHFPTDTSAYDVGYKALAVNLSDIAAMGGEPEWFTLALTLPEIDHKWLKEFSDGLKSLAKEVCVALIGGDTTSGPLAISIQMMGSVDKNKAIYRSGAQKGDKIYVTGTLGDGRAGLLSTQGLLDLKSDHAIYCQNRLNRPIPRLNESRFIKDFANSCIDVSDGLLQDLSHILKQSNLTNDEEILGAELDLTKIPLSNALISLNSDQSVDFSLTGGDDYELLFTIPETLESQFLEANSLESDSLRIKLLDTNAGEYKFTCIGVITSDEGIVDINKRPLNIKGFNHFS